MKFKQGTLLFTQKYSINSNSVVYHYSVLKDDASYPMLRKSAFIYFFSITNHNSQLSENTEDPI